MILRISCQISERKNRDVFLSDDPTSFPDIGTLKKMSRQGFKFYLDGSAVYLSDVLNAVKLSKSNKLNI